ncbi:hypothetical protein NGRA_2156, partial [Nosema granulosis]
DAIENTIDTMEDTIEDTIEVDNMELGLKESRVKKLSTSEKRKKVIYIVIGVTLLIICVLLGGFLYLLFNMAGVKVLNKIFFIVSFVINIIFITFYILLFNYSSKKNTEIKNY